MRYDQEIGVVEASIAVMKAMRAEDIETAHELDKIIRASIHREFSRGDEHEPRDVHVLTKKQASRFHKTLQKYRD